MKIYTVTSTDDIEREPLSRCVAGSYTSRGLALDECVKYIIERLEIRDDLAQSMANDENHPEARTFFSEYRKDGCTFVRIRKGFVKKLKEFIRDELGGQGCYYVYDGYRSWHFDIDENDVEGELWTTVTWGDSDCENPEFTTPRPEVFTSQETAVRTFIDYVDDLVKSRSGGDFGLAKDVVRRIRKELEDGDRSQVDLNDGCCVSCIIYSTQAEDVR